MYRTLTLKKVKVSKVIIPLDRLVGNYRIYRQYRFLAKVVRLVALYDPKFRYAYALFRILCKIILNFKIGNIESNDWNLNLIWYLCFSSLYLCVHSLKSIWFISMKSFNALYIRPWIVLFQWLLELRYSAGNMIGIMCVAFSDIRDMMYSLFQ